MTDRELETSFKRTRLECGVMARKLEEVVVGRKGMDGTRAEFQVMRYNTVFPVIMGCATCKFDDLGSEVCNQMIKIKGSAHLTHQHQCAGCDSPSSRDGGYD